jgi:hypothetical protein
MEVDEWKSQRGRWAREKKIRTRLQAKKNQKLRRATLRFIDSYKQQQL